MPLFGLAVHRLCEPSTLPSQCARRTLPSPTTSQACLTASLRCLLWHINKRVVEETSRLTLVHAGGLELDGQGIVMPAVMESGKTTTTAGLLRRGLRYLSDEIVAVDPDSLTLLAYPKALTVEPGSF